MSVKTRWLFVVALCAVCAGLIGYWWYREITEYVPNAGQVPSQAAVDAALDDGRPHPGRIRIPTGVFIQSVEFVKANDVNVTGYVWQKYSDDIPAEVSRGFVFPEEVGSAETVIREDTHPLSSIPDRRIPRHMATRWSSRTSTARDNHPGLVTGAAVVLRYTGLRASPFEIK